MNLDQVKSWLEQNHPPVFLALIGLAIFGGGLFWLKTGNQPETKVEILSATSDQDHTKTVYVDISGAVNQPGVYQLEAGSRVEDALQAAGGLTAQAQTKWIETALNRATVLIDGAKIYIPAVGEEESPAANGLMKTVSEKINLNSASQSELESLVGIGPVTAEKIISGRPYQTIEELVSKKILSQKLFDKLKDQLAVW